MKKKLKWVIAGAVVVLAGIAFYSTQTGGVEAEVCKVARGEIKEYLEDTAQVLSRDEQTVYIEGSGKVIAVHVNVGDVVKQGDLLASLDKTDLELKLKDAEAGILAAKAQLKGTELSNYAGKIDMAKVAVDQAAIAYDSAQRSWANAQKLYAAAALSEDEFAKAKAAYEEAAAALDLAKLQLADVQQGAPEHLKNSYQAQLEQAVIYRDTMLRSIQKQEVRAPSDGVIMERLVEKNAQVAPSTAAFVIGNVNHLELEAEILADDANKVKIGDEVEISGKPLDDTVLKGKVSKIAPAAKTVTSTLGVNQKRVPVTISLAGESSLLKPGYDVDVKIITVAKGDVIKVPDSAVFEYKGKSHVFVVEKGKALLRTVTKGIESESFIEIQEGLQEGDLVLVKPDNSIKEGVKIKPREEKQ